MTDKLEEVARAICAEQGRSWGAADASAHDRWRDLARAAIEAMREPTDEMCAAADSLDVVNKGVLITPTPYRAWQAMIDAALSPPGVMIEIARPF